ncbi:prefoldin subunit beta [Stetteria hydrogenophila]
MERVPPEVQVKLEKLAQARNNLASVLQQKSSYEALLRELEETISVVEGLKDDALLFKMVGGVLVKVSRDELLNELKERKTAAEIRLKKLEAFEKKFREEVERLEKEIQSMVSRLGKEGASAG